jgi:hypothetical protein
MEAKYQAFRLANEMPQQMRALGELAISLSEIGAFDAARLAFQLVIESRASLEVRANSTLELMDLESSVGNRVAFERQRAAAETFRSRMSPRMAVDYLFKLGVGLSRFGQVSRGQTFLKSALELAEEHRLNDWYFKIEKAVAELAERKQEESQPRLASELCESPAVRQVELGLRDYAALAAT